MINANRSYVSRLSVVFLLATITFPAHSQEFDTNAVHWAYASYFGTGWYRLGDEGDAFVIRVTPRWEVREASIDNGQRKIGFEVRLPVTAGLDTFTLDDPSGSVDPTNLANLTITPGVNVTIPVNDRWLLRPYASAGWGTVISNSESAWTYWAGILSQFAFETGNLDWALVNSAGYVGYTSNFGQAEDFWPLMTGLELDHSLGRMKIGEQQVMLTWHGMYTRFGSDLDAALEDGTASKIPDQWEFGVAMRTQDRRMKFWLFHFERLGLAYRFSSNREFKGVAVVFRSVFDR